LLSDVGVLQERMIEKIKSNKVILINSGCCLRSNTPNL
jgi:hypothetical protein